MALRVIYRSYGGENQKGRPDYYSKLVGLLSFLRAAQHADAEVVYLNDGPIPADRMRLMQASGQLVTGEGLGLRGSYRLALRLATSGRWGPEDIVWFSEDDYLYRSDALVRLRRAAELVPAAEYFALYASTAAHPAKRDDEPWAHRPAGWLDLPPWQVDGQRWMRIYSTTSTFGARIDALTEDMGIFRFCMFPHRRMLRDHDTGLVVQGFEPYGYRDLARTAIGRSDGDVRERVREALLSPVHLATNLRAHRRPSRRRLMLAADPNLATHMELGLVADGQDWPAIAEEARAWERERPTTTAGSPRT